MLKLNVFLSTLLVTIPAYSSCLTVDDLLSKHNIPYSGEIETTHQLKTVILDKISAESPEDITYYSKLIDELYPRLNNNTIISDQDISWVDNFIPSPYLSNFTDLVKNKNILAMDGISTFDAKYFFARKMSREDNLFLDFMNNKSTIVVTKNDVTNFLTDLDGVTPFGKDYTVDDMGFVYLEQRNTFVIAKDVFDVKDSDYLPFEIKNIDHTLDFAACFTQNKSDFRNEQYSIERQSNQYTDMNIDFIMNEIKNDLGVLDFIAKPEGKCFNSAHHIGSLLEGMGVPASSIKYRLSHLTRDGVNWKSVNLENNENHMVVMLNHRDGKYIFDPTIIQFHGIDDPFYGLESDWKEALRPAWDGRVQKKAVQYIDYNNYSSADNASIGYRNDFDKMTDDGGIFINKPRWYEEFYMIQHSANPPLPDDPYRPTGKPKRKRFLMCLRPNIMD